MGWARSCGARCRGPRRGPEVCGEMRPRDKANRIARVRPGDERDATALPLGLMGVADLTNDREAESGVRRV